MSLLINYPVTAAGVLALVTLLAYVGGNWRRDLYCPEYGFDGIDPGSYCYWSVVNALLVPCAITVFILGLGLVVRALSVTLAFVLLLSYSAGKTRDLVKAYPWYCLLAAVVLFGPWDWRFGWIAAGCLGRLALVLCACLAAGTKLTLSYLVRIALAAWSRIQLETAVCERVRTKVIDSHVAFGLIWLPFFASGTGSHWLGYLWRITNPHARCGSPLPKSGLDAPTPINYEKLRAQLMEDAAGIAARRCGRISAAMTRLLGGRSFVYSWTLNDEFARLEREHPEKEGLEAWKQEKDRQAGIWDAIQAERKAGQVIPGAYDTGNPCPKPPTRGRRADCGELGGGILADIVSMVLLNVLSLSSFLRFPSRLSPSSCPNRPAPASGPALVDAIDQSLPRASVADSSSHSSQRKQSRRRTGFGISSSRSTTLDRPAIPLPTRRSQPAPKAAAPTKAAIRIPAVHTPPRATARAPTCRSNLTNASTKEISDVRSDSQGSKSSVEGFAVAYESPLGIVSTDSMFEYCPANHEPLAAQQAIVPARPLPYTSASYLCEGKYPSQDHILATSDHLGSETMGPTVSGSSVPEVVHLYELENRRVPATSSGLIEEPVTATSMGAPALEILLGSTRSDYAAPISVTGENVEKLPTQSPAVVLLRPRTKAARTRLEPPVYIPDGVFLLPAHRPRLAAPSSMDTNMDLESASSAAASIVPPFSRMVIEEDEVDAEMTFDVVDTPDITMSSPELEDVEMFDPPTPPSRSPMLIDAREVPEVLMDSPPLGCRSSTSIKPIVGPTFDGCQAIVPVYTQPGAWEGFMLWHRELARSTVVPVCFVPPIPQVWFRPAPAIRSEFGSSREGVGYAWVEASPETTNPEWTDVILDTALIQATHHAEHVDQGPMDIPELARAFADLTTPGAETGTSEVTRYLTSTAESAAEGWAEDIIEHPASREDEPQDQSTVTSLSQAFAGMWAPDAGPIPASGSINIPTGNPYQPETGTTLVSGGYEETESAGQVEMDDLVDSLKCMRASSFDHSQSRVSKVTRMAVITEVGGSSTPDFVGLDADEGEREEEEELAEVEKQLGAETEAETDGEDADEAEANPEEVSCVEDPDAAAEAFLAEMQAQGLLGPATLATSSWVNAHRV